ncbi:synaptogenesis protein syg-2-like isoform X2 [Pollicipes pollicipes]|uniref:synaptogenesis protein syg-2-like isoform X2 n=1 Tax=Pollicipes pollicipes TaxID=41117 RepID=UPI001884CC50|nr:synaptogenesis protein syg-2-like isoform X2 [Pollicipes pollicipes]
MDVLCQQQRFRVRPSNVSVVEGDSAILRCEVHHQVGQLQWAKDGFALGYSRSLPGYSRYRMLGDPGSGVHDLEVTNVSLDDDGRFQCQVSPNRGQAAIRADALLTVLVKPKSVRASSTARSPRAGLYEVREGSQLTLKCDVTGARPAASIRWQRNGVDIELGQEDSFSGWGSPRRNDTTSVVTLQPTAADDGAGYSCVAKHPAIRPAEQRQLNSTVRLSVLYPPGAPTIEGHSEGEWVRIGEQKTLTCVSRGGNPPAEIVWYKDDQPVTFKYRTLGGRAMAQLSFTVEAADLDVIYRCQASSSMHPAPMVALAQMNVQFGPERVTVSGTSEAKGGDMVHMTCVTSGSNPPANITWVINGRTMMNTSQSRQPHPSGGWVATSNISTTVPPGMEKNMDILCYALNPKLGTTKVGSTEVTVLHPPKPPSILGYEPGTYLRAGERVSLSCVSQGGNPPATLTWYSGDVERPSPTTVEDNVARSVITFEVDHKDNGRVYKCDSQNSAGSGVQSAGITLNVYFPTSSLKLEVRPERLRAGSQAILTCESRPSYPAADLTWWRDNAQVTDGVTALETFPAGSHGGSSSRVQLRKNLTWSDDGAVYQCRAAVTVLSGRLQEEITLEVTYAPTFFKSLYTEDIRVGESRLINLTARANPGDTTYRWYRVSPIDAARIMPEGPLLNISKVVKKDAGWYYLEAANAEGNTSVRVNINVQYAPEILSVSEVSLVSPGDDGVLECAADANPSTADMITWHRAGFNLSSNRSKMFYSNGTSYLTLYNVTKEDIGEFQCRANNAIGEASTIARLLVKHAPEMDTSPQFRAAAAAPGGTAHLTCRARGAPNVTFEWRRDDSAVTPSANSDKYRMRYSQVDLVTWQSVLEIKDVQASDYATYGCVAHNELSSRRQELVLGRPSSPDPPTGLKVVNVSHDTATLSWSAGFDGGMPQMYTVRYKTSSGGEFLYDDVQPENTTLFTVRDLLPSTDYSFAVMAYNELGQSGYSNTAATTKTTGDPDTAELVVLEEGRLPWIVIIVVSSVGGLLLLLNVVLVVFFIRRRMQRAKQKVVESASASEASTKSETLHMYGNETVSSVSVKSGESYTREDSVEDYDDDGSKRRYDAYLRDAPIEPPAEYTNHVRPASRADFDPDQYADALRRNSYACTIGSGVEPMSNQFSNYTTQPPRAPHFRSPQFNTPTPDLLHSSGPSGVKGSVPQLSLQSTYYPETRHYSTLPHQRPPSTKPLSSFGRLASPPPPSIPEATLEHRGHLV